MKIVKGFVLRSLSGDNVVMPQGSALMKLNGLLILNETSAFIWKNMDGEFEINDLVTKVCEEYKVDENKAKKDVEEFIERLKTVGCVE